ncbi:MAG: hypothetical protein HY000_31170 [Planctomycetes bacterium]|nr:hypothetical protein [Planctomycetota bacterium]
MTLKQLLFLDQYDPNLATWVYISALLTIGIYFKFNRVWSVRNLDLALLISLAPALLLLEQGNEAAEWAGHVWLIVASGCLLVRLLVDPLMVRRPLLEPNLTTGGLTFMGAALLIFLMTNVITGERIKNDSKASMTAVQASAQSSDAPRIPGRGNGYPLFEFFEGLSRHAAGQTDEASPREAQLAADRVLSALAIFAHLSVVFGLLVIGYWHYGNIKTGVAAAALYLLLPYTSLMTKVPHLSVDHLLPSALLVWAIVAYRRPLISGALLGLAAGAIFYPVFLLPLWAGFYWQRGLARFLIGFTVTLLICLGLLVVSTGSIHAVLNGIREAFAWSQDSHGFWSMLESLWNVDRVWRIPVLTAFFALAASFALWPAQKNLGTLLSCSAAVMLGTQFWLAHGGGPYMGWYLPLVLLTVFRPNLEDRVALAVLGEGNWFQRRRQPARSIKMAA